jgi:hypothetical protein
LNHVFAAVSGDRNSTVRRGAARVFGGNNKVVPLGANEFTN